MFRFLGFLIFDFIFFSLQRLSCCNFCIVLAVGVLWFDDMFAYCLYLIINFCFKLLLGYDMYFNDMCGNILNILTVIFLFVVIYTIWVA